MAILSLSNVNDREYDFIVVGSGPASFSFLSHLDKSFKVLILEAGLKDFDLLSQSLYEGYVDPLGYRHEPLDKFRIRQLGGSSNCWGGACVPFDSFDFDILESNQPLWPISYQSLIPFYKKVGFLCGIGDYFAIKNQPSVFRRKIPGLRQGFWLVNDTNKNFSTRVLELAHNSSTFDLCLGANVVDVVTGETNRVSHIVVSSYNLDSFVIRCNRLIVCAGGLESTRLFLNWHHKHKLFSSIESSLGRYYSPHINMYSGKIVVRPDALGNPKYVNLSSKIKARSFFSLDFTPDLHHKYLNSKWTLEPEYNSLQSLGDFKSFAYNLKTIDTAQDMISKIIKRGDSPPDLKRYLSSGRQEASSFNLNVAFDQTPCASSRISLNSNKDIFGLGKITLRHDILPTDISRIENTFLALALLFGRYNVGRMNIGNTKHFLSENSIGASHHTGGLRMADHHSCGCVDSQLKVHGIDNIWVCSSAVFPTPSHANPTFTIMALAARLSSQFN